MLAVALSNEFGRNLNKTMRNDLKKSAEISKNHCGGLWRIVVENCCGPVVVDYAEEAV